VLEPTTSELAAENVALRAELAERNRVAGAPRGKRRRTEDTEPTSW
jgi:hypothetical protein